MCGGAKNSPQKITLQYSEIDFRNFHSKHIAKMRRMMIMADMTTTAALIMSALFGMIWTESSALQAATGIRSEVSNVRFVRA